MPENPLRTIMRPSSIAIVGASNNLTKMGTIQYLNLVGGGMREKFSRFIQKKNRYSAQRHMLP